MRVDPEKIRSVANKQTKNNFSAAAPFSQTDFSSGVPFGSNGGYKSSRWGPSPGGPASIQLSKSKRGWKQAISKKAAGGRRKKLQK